MVEVELSVKKQETKEGGREVIYTRGGPPPQRCVELTATHRKTLHRIRVKSVAWNRNLFRTEAMETEK